MKDLEGFCNEKLSQNQTQNFPSLQQLQETIHQSSYNSTQRSANNCGTGNVSFLIFSISLFLVVSAEYIVNIFEYKSKRSKRAKGREKQSW